MPRDFYKSEQGEAAYKEIGMEYPEEMYDTAYAAFLKLTKNTPEKEVKYHIQNMKRYITSTGEQFLVHDIVEEKSDPIGNRKRFHRGNIGKYGKPIPRYEIKVNPEEGYAKSRIVTGIEEIVDSYSIPFTAKNIDPLLKYCDGNTSYSIQKEDHMSGRRISVRSLEEWKTGKVEELLRFGHAASSYEKQVLADEKIGKYLDHTSTYAAGRVYT